MLFGMAGCGLSFVGGTDKGGYHAPTDRCASRIQPLQMAQGDVLPVVAGGNRFVSTLVYRGDRHLSKPRRSCQSPLQSERLCYQWRAQCFCSVFASLQELELLHDMSLPPCARPYVPEYSRRAPLHVCLGTPTRASSSGEGEPLRQLCEATCAHSHVTAEVAGVGRVCQCIIRQSRRFPGPYLCNPISLYRRYRGRKRYKYAITITGEGGGALAHNARRAGEAGRLCGGVHGAQGRGGHQLCAPHWGRGRNRIAFGRSGDRTREEGHAHRA